MLETEKDLGLIAVVGSPNSGKTTLYNWITGSKFKTVNYPGSTVDYALGDAADKLGVKASFIDTPGTYSLFPQSADEEVTQKVIFSGVNQAAINAIILVCDGTQWTRQLLLAKQLLPTGFPLILVLTMKDMLDRSGISIKPEVLSSELGIPVVLFNGLSGAGLDDIVQAIKDNTKPLGKVTVPDAWGKSQLDAYHLWAKQLKPRVQTTSQASKGPSDFIGSGFTQRVDSFLLHPLLGFLLFILVMTGLFSSIFWLAKPLMDGVDWAFSSAGDLIKLQSGEALWGQFLADGILSSFSAVFVFVPQIFILFLGIGILESSGYLARAATLIDKPFSFFGLSGRSFVPVLSGFACAVPAIMAARNLSSSREKWIVSFIIPLLTCSARIPVYALLISFLMHKESSIFSGFVMALMYLGSLVVGGLAAGFLNLFLPKSNQSHLMMELPVYRLPRAKVIFTQSLQRTKKYIERAGPVIFVFAVILWVGTNFPRYESTGTAKEVQAEMQIENSFLGKAGHLIEPVFKPLGVDWRVGVGLLSAFAAREVFVSSLAVVMQVTNTEDGQTEGLIAAMKSAKNSAGDLVFTTATIIGLLIFFMIALQCMSTVAIVQREFGSWGFALGQLAAFNVLAYVFAVGAVTGLRAFGVN